MTYHEKRGNCEPSHSVPSGHGSMVNSEVSDQYTKRNCSYKGHLRKIKRLCEVEVREKDGRLGGTTYWVLFMNTWPVEIGHDDYAHTL